MDTRPNDQSVAAIAHHRRMISAKALAGLRKAKNRPDQAALRTSCTANSPSAVRLAAHPARRQTSQAASAISTYRVVQTGPNTQSGGVHAGLRRVGYQSRTGPAVSAAPTAAVPKQTASRTSN